MTRSAPLLACLVCAAAVAAPFRPPPAPDQPVTDEAGFLSPGARQALNDRLKDAQPQVVVWIGDPAPDVTIEEFAAKTFEAWGVGRKGADDGVGIFVFGSARTVRIEVGYGLEGTLTDAIASQIIRTHFIPAARAGDHDAAVIATVDAVVQAVGATGAAPLAVVLPPWWQLAIWAVVALLFLILLITHPRLALLLLLNVVGHGRRSSGFGGRGGRSGGGGATGTW